MKAAAGRSAAAAIKAGIAYFVVVFAAGFVLGALRIMVVAPRIGALAAVLVELPLMLAISWFVCLRLIPRLGVGPAWSERLLMGAVAFVLLILAELTLSVAAFGGTVAGFAANLGTPEGMVGLLGQIAFAAMPLLVGRRLP